MYGEKKDKRLIEFNTEEPRSLMYTFRNHSVLDLGICYNTKSNRDIPLVYVGQDKFSIDSKKTIEEYLNRQVDKNYKNFSQKRIDLEKNKINEFIPEYDKHQSILNLYINVQFILDELEKILDSGEVNAKTLLNFVKNILKKLQENLGDINEFDLVYDEELFQYFVVDRELVPDKIESIINLTGLRSTLTNLSFSSKITPRLASMIAVSAQAGGTDVGLDTENMFRWNRGLKDRIVPRKILNVDQPEAVNTDTLVTDIRSLDEYVKAFNQSYDTTGRNYNKEELKSLSTLHASIMRRLATIESNTGKNGAKGIIPFELSLTLDGIGGVKIGQAFKVNKGILPTTYDDIIAFLVNRVNHNIQGNRWSTELTAQTIVIDPKPSSLEAIPVDLTKAVVDESVADLPFTVSSDFTQRKLPSELAVNQDTINLIKRFEGFEEKAYPDPGSKGKPITIGYGTTRINGNPILEGQTITESEAEKLLRKDVNRFAESVRGLVKVKLTESEFGALVSFAYNAGPGNLGASTLLRYLNSERYIDASNQFLRWTKASGVQLKGLIKRRQAEKQLFLKGSPGDPK